MKAMKDDRKRFMSKTAAEGRKRKAKTRKFMANTNAANAELKAETHQVLADADKFMADTHKANAELKADAAATVKHFAQASRKRAADWQDTLRTVHGGGRSAPARTPVATTVMAAPAKPKPKPKAKAKGKGKKKARPGKR